ncbi:MAG: DUF4926 domain-containing protein [Phycisphaerales bacterium]
MLKEHDTVALTVDRPEDGLRRGDVGAVVHCHRDGHSYEVEFIDERGRTKAVATVAGDQLIRLNVLSLSA